MQVLPTKNKIKEIINQVNKKALEEYEKENKKCKY